jgi:hypothetical protein
MNDKEIKAAIDELIIQAFELGRYERRWSRQPGLGGEMAFEDIKADLHAVRLALLERIGIKEQEA